MPDFRTTNPLMTPAEVAMALGLKPRTLDNWRYRGEGPLFRKIGGRVMYAQSDLLTYMESTARRHTRDGGPAA